ncbi:hypothetical protein DPMN_085153 [Dreissena polymorpha]|uniref:Uncharacterized protein n=1 Tax=Dreissena polymorpha TaxID=45954 RepID=A0A9D3YBV9_DREPO|nr:hypothetical protein DPMN_085153 [Dreissena polymorpha]
MWQGNRRCTRFLAPTFVERGDQPGPCEFRGPGKRAHENRGTREFSSSDATAESTVRGAFSNNRQGAH